MDFDLERPVSAVQSVLLDEVQVIHTCDLETEKKKNNSAARGNLKAGALQSLECV